jgi:hypothetical protein
MSSYIPTTSLRIASLLLVALSALSFQLVSHKQAPCISTLASPIVNTFRLRDRDITGASSLDNNLEASEKIKLDKDICDLNNEIRELMVKSS